MFSASSEQSSLSQAKLLVTHRGPRVKCHVHFVLYIVQACFFFAKQIILDLRSNAIMSIVNIVLGLHLKHCSKFSINTHCLKQNFCHNSCKRNATLRLAWYLQVPRFSAYGHTGKTYNNLCFNKPTGRLGQCLQTIPSPHFPRT